MVNINKYKLLLVAKYTVLVKDIKIAANINIYFDIVASMRRKLR